MGTPATQLRAGSLRRRRWAKPHFAEAIYAVPPPTTASLSSLWNERAHYEHQRFGGFDLLVIGSEVKYGSNPTQGLSTVLKRVIKTNKAMYSG